MALAPLALAACSKEASAPAGTGADASGKSAADSGAQASAAHGGGGASAGQRAVSAGRSGAAGEAGTASDAGARAGSGSAEDPSGDGGTDDSSEPAVVPPGDLTEEIATGLASAMCSALRDCVGASGLRALVGRESCEQRFAGSYAQNGFALLEDSVARKRSVVHQELLEQCYRDTAALGCDVQRERPPSSCTQAIEGLVAAGDTCSSGWDCAGDAFCAPGECPRTCVPRVAAGSACSADNDCVSGLLCVDQKCVAPALAGESCGGKTGVPCVLDAACEGGSDTATGTCRANKDILVAELGASCDLATVYCQEGLSCGYDGSGLSCQNPVSSGEKCHLAAPAQCPIEEYCNAKAIDQEGRCQALPVAGEACVLDGECAGGYACVLENEKPVCHALRNLGETCNQAGECRSGRCDAGQCGVGDVCD